MDTTLLIFLLVYVALAVGHLPGFRLDRTGAVVVGALAMLVTNRIGEGAAWDAIDYKAIWLLFGLMIVSGGFVVSGFYAWVAARVASLQVKPAVLLALLVATGGVLSAFLTNNVVVVAMTPLLVAITLSRGLNPVPFLIGFCFACNAGAAATIIGSPKNMIAAQALGLSFNGFLKVALVPALLTLPLVWAVIVWLYRKRWTLAPTEPVPAPAITPVDKREAIKTGVIMLAVILAFVVTSWPHELVALGAAAIMLVSRSVSSKDVVKAVDGNLLLLLMGLFVVNAAFAATGVPQKVIADLASAGVDLTHPLALLGAGSVLSNIVGNNPTVMLIAPLLGHAADPQALGAALILGTSFASNLVIFGSLAGIIVVEQAAAHGVRIGLAEYSRAGIPVALISLVVAAAWIGLVLL